MKHSVLTHNTGREMSGLTLRQVVYGFGCIPLCIIGLLGNIFSLVVLYPSKYNQTKVQTDEEGSD